MIQSAFVSCSDGLQSCVINDAPVKQYLTDAHDASVCVVDLPNDVFLYVDYTDNDVADKLIDLESRFADITAILIVPRQGNVADKLADIEARVGDMSVADLVKLRRPQDTDDIISLIERLPRLQYLHLEYCDHPFEFSAMRLPELLEFNGLPKEGAGNLSLPNLRHLVTQEGFDINELNSLLDAKAFPKLMHLGFQDEYHSEKLTHIHWPDSCISVGLIGLWGDEDIECLAAQPWAKQLQRIETYWGEYCDAAKFNVEHFPQLQVLRVQQEFDPMQFVETFNKGDLSQVKRLDFRGYAGMINLDDQWSDYEGQTMEQYTDFVQKLPAGMTVDLRHCGYGELELPGLPALPVETLV